MNEAERFRRLLVRAYVLALIALAVSVFCCTAVFRLRKEAVVQSIILRGANEKCQLDISTTDVGPFIRFEGQDGKTLASASVTTVDGEAVVFVWFWDAAGDRPVKTLRLDQRGLAADPADDDLRSNGAVDAAARPTDDRPE